jgi:hypothetical protein
MTFMPSQMGTSRIVGTKLLSLKKALFTFMLEASSCLCPPLPLPSTNQLPSRCDVLLGVPGLDVLGVRLDAHRGAQRLPLECHVGERTLRTWLDANAGKTEDGHKRAV